MSDDVLKIAVTEEVVHRHLSLRRPIIVFSPEMGWSIFV